MQALLLLAGRSRRFWPLAEKAMWPFIGESLLSHQIRRLKEGGMDSILFVGGRHNIEQVHDMFPRVPSIEQENLDLGMRGAFLSALPEIKDAPVCVVSSNDVIEPHAYKSLIKASMAEGVDGVILAQRVKRYFPGGYLITSPCKSAGCDYQRVAGIVEKPENGREPSDLVNIVAHIHNKPDRLLDALEEVTSGRDDAYEVALTKLCQELNYVAVPYDGLWNAVKYPWHVLDLTQRFLDGLPDGQRIDDSADVHPTAVVRGNVIVEGDAKIMPHSTVEGPCFVGRNTIIGNNSLVRNSIIGEKCVIGYNSEVVRSNLHSHVWTHTAYLGDSVIGTNVSFGAGSISANFRLDEDEIFSDINGARMGTQRAKLGIVTGDNVRVGVNASFAPGVKIGAGTFVNSSVSVTQDIGDHKFVTEKNGVVEIRENKADVPRARL